MSAGEYIQILIRLIILSLLILLGCWTIVNDGSPVRVFFISGAVIVAIVECLRYLAKWRNQVATILTAFEAGDPTGIPVVDEGLHDSLQRIAERIRTTNSLAQANRIYLDLLVKHLDVGVLCLDQQQQVVLANDAWYRQVGLERINRIGQGFWDNHWMGKALLQHSDKFSRLIRELDGGKREFAVRQTDFRLEGEEYRLFTVADIAAELSRKEQEAWQNLLGVMTHEIMNSIAPISSLSQSLEDRMLEAYTHLSLPESWLPAVQAIRNRSDKLLKFSEDYRLISKLPSPDPVEVEINLLLDRLTRLLTAQYPSISIRYEHEENLVFADEGMLEQLLINLIKNACEALVGLLNPTIIIHSVRKENHTIITVSDNGPGIPAELVDRIFLPFYTTRSEGTGIGLSLCRQIMMAHNGEITVQSNPGMTTFSLSFPVPEIIHS